MRLRPALILAAPAGVLGGHAIGYLAAPGPAGAAALHHGYLALALAVAVPLGVLAVGWAATAGAAATPASAPAAGGRSVPVGPLLLAQWVLFVGQEAVEHAAAGHGAPAALQSPALWCGLAAQVITALAVVMLLRASAVTGARLVSLLGARLLVPVRSLSWLPPRPSRRRSWSRVVTCPSRGPPGPRFA